MDRDALSIMFGVIAIFTVSISPLVGTILSGLGLYYGVTGLQAKRKGQEPTTYATIGIVINSLAFLVLLLITLSLTGIAIKELG